MTTEMQRYIQVKGKNVRNFVEATGDGHRITGHILLIQSHRFDGIELLKCEQDCVEFKLTYESDDFDWHQETVRRITEALEPMGDRGVCVSIH